jgi:hypothetical protein
LAGGQAGRFADGNGGHSRIFGSTKESKLIASSTFAPQGAIQTHPSDLYEKTSHSNASVHQTVVYFID